MTTEIPHNIISQCLIINGKHFDFPWTFAKAKPINPTRKMTKDLTPISVRFTDSGEILNAFILRPDWKVNIKHTCKEINPTRTHMNKEQIEKLIAHTKSNVSNLQEELNRFACCIARCSKILGDERSLLSALESDLEALCEEDEE